MNRPPCEQLRSEMPVAAAKIAANENGRPVNRKQFRSGKQRGRREFTTSPRRRKRIRRRRRIPHAD